MDFVNKSSEIRWDLMGKVSVPHGNIQEQDLLIMQFLGAKVTVSSMDG